MRTKQLTLAEVLAQADAATSRKEAIKLIQLADKMRAELCQQNNPYPLY